jgi:hypothetical protein
MAARPNDRTDPNSSGYLMGAYGSRRSLCPPRARSDNTTWHSRSLTDARLEDDLCFGQVVSSSADQFRAGDDLLITSISARRGRCLRWSAASGAAGWSAH